MTDDYDERLAIFGRAYHVACEDVQCTWNVLVHTKFTSYEGFKAAAQGDYKAACERARAARDALIKHASQGLFEVGQ